MSIHPRRDEVPLGGAAETPITSEAAPSGDTIGRARSGRASRLTSRRRLDSQSVCKHAFASRARSGTVSEGNLGYDVEAREAVGWAVYEAEARTAMGGAVYNVEARSAINQGTTW